MGFQTTTKRHIIEIIRCDCTFIVADPLEFHHVEFISSQNISTFSNVYCFLITLPSYENIVLIPSCQWQKYQRNEDVQSCSWLWKYVSWPKCYEPIHRIRITTAIHNFQPFFALFTEEVLKKQNFYPDSKAITQYPGFVLNRLNFSPQQLVEHCGFDLVC